MRQWGYGTAGVLALILGCVSPGFAQTDTTNVWFSNGPTGLHNVQSILVHPTYPNNVFAGTLPGTLWRSANSGSSWNEIGTSIADSVLAIAAVSADSSVIFAGTMHSGVYKSLDFGATWSTTAFGGRQVNAIAIDPRDSTKIYVGTPDSLFKTTNGGVSWSFAGLDSVLVTAIAFQPLESVKP